MNLRAITLISGVALAAFVTPGVATAQSGGRSGPPRGVTTMSAQRQTAPSSVSRSGPSQAVPRSGDISRSNHRSPTWDRNHRGRFVNNYYYYGGYPYYGYGFGYPFGYGYGYPFPYGYGYGYGYGYPSFGVSATFSNYSPYYGNRAYSSRGGSVAVRVQQRLAQAGYYRGSIDGVIGSGTRSAIRAYERAHGLPVDGQIDSALLSRLGVS